MKVRKFNLKPRDGVQYLQLRGFLSAEPADIPYLPRSPHISPYLPTADIARFLHERRGGPLSSVIGLGHRVW